MKRIFLVAIAVISLLFQFQLHPSNAVELDEATRTVKLNEMGETTVLTLKQFKEGSRLFMNNCSNCHLNGTTKTNPNINLSLNALAGAYPPRDNIEGLVDYIQNPTTYDGEDEIYELHPSIKSADIFPEMRNITEDDLYSIAGYILVQPKINPRWGK